MALGQPYREQERVDADDAVVVVVVSGDRAVIGVDPPWSPYSRRL